jgi:Kdo2-lipid IVA lauroyltransferase/acyltransferase
MRDRLNLRLALALLWLIGRLPQPLRHALGLQLGRLIMRYNAKRRAIVATNLEWAFPEQTAAWRKVNAERFFANYASSLLDLGHYWWCSREVYQREIEFDGLEPIVHWLANGERVVIAAMHSVGMDIGGVALSLHLPLATFANELRNPLLSAHLSQRRGRFGCSVVTRRDGIRAAVRELQQGRALFFPADEDQGDKEGVDTRFIPLFGIAKSTLTSPWRLARLGKARLVVAATLFDTATRRYRVHLSPAIDATTLEGALTEMNQHLEQFIRRAPDQMMWNLRLFQSRPNGSPAPYVRNGQIGSGPRPRPASFDH